jgi:hypothetical protein
MNLLRMGGLQILHSQQLRAARGHVRVFQPAVRVLGERHRKPGEELLGEILHLGIEPAPARSHAMEDVNYLHKDMEQLRAAAWKGVNTTIIRKHVHFLELRIQM